MNVDYAITKESYVTMMGPIGNCLILFMIDFVVKYLSEWFSLVELLWFRFFFFTFDSSFW